jgi:hypothetical protein
MKGIEIFLFGFGLQPFENERGTVLMASVAIAERPLGKMAAK